MGAAVFHRLEPGTAHHQHARSAAVGLVIHFPVFIVGKIAQIDEIDRARPLPDGARDHALGQKTREHARLDADNVNLQHLFSCTKAKNPSL